MTDQTSRFFQALFPPSAQVIIRLIETWVEGGRKQSQIDYKATRYERFGLRDCSGNWVPWPDKINAVLQEVADRAEETKSNVFFGVCSRIGDHGRYDQAWQIRDITAVWCDVDNATVEEVRERIRAAGLPEPSMIVMSGNGCHVYWLLDQLYKIDDVGDPQPVCTEWPDDSEGDKKRKPRDFLLSQDGEKLYLDSPRNIPPLSPKAQHFQDLLAGVAAKIGGDHATDLSRLLRIPGTLNRKDERNGRQPVPCSLVECDPGRRYPLEIFERFLSSSPSKTRREKVARVSLPAARPLTPSRQDRLSELIRDCDAAPVGSRSDTDFALCCWAVENGVPRDELWSKVSSVGKFAEGGERYFAITWDKAEGHTREKFFAESEKKTIKKVEAKGQAAAGESIEEEDPSSIKLLADAICEHNHFAQDAGGRLYRYAEGVYRSKAEEFIRGKVKALCLAWGTSKEWSSRRAAEVIEFIRVDAPELWERPPLDVLNVKNGLLRIRDRQLLPHTPDHLSSVQLPVAYESTAQCPETEKFISQVFPSDAHNLAWEIVGWLMLPDTSIQKAVLLTGEGSNGKSTWLRQVIALLGKPNTSAISLHKLESDKFAVARLLGKLANICPDLPSEHLAGTSIFKQIVGGDTLTAERKFQDSFDFIPFSRLVFSANHPPRSQDASHAFFRRWLVIHFGRTFAPDEQIPGDILDARLADPGELSGVLNKALDAFPRLKQQRGFSEPESVKQAWSEFYSVTDPLGVWLDRYTIDDPDAFVPKNILRAAYNAAAEQAGRPTMNQTAFGTAIKRHRPKITDGRRTVNASRPECYIGIGLARDLQIPGGSVGSVGSLPPSVSLSQGKVDGSSEEGEAQGGFWEEQEGENSRHSRHPGHMNGNGQCPCSPRDWVEREVDGEIVTRCGRCKKFIGKRPVEAESEGSNGFL